LPPAFIPMLNRAAKSPPKLSVSHCSNTQGLDVFETEYIHRQPREMSSRDWPLKINIYWSAYVSVK
jgi:hypothetical protein